MANRIDSRNFALPDLSDSRSSSPGTSSTSMARHHPTALTKSENQFVLPSQAFVPIKDSVSAAQKEAKRKEIDVILQQQSKMHEKLKELEASNQHLLSEMNNLKRQKENSIVGGQAEHALRNATDMTLYLTKKLQNMHEAITKMEVKLQQHEKAIQEEKGGITALVDKVVEIELNTLANCGEQITKHSNELLAFRDSLQDLRKKLSEEQMERKSNEQKIFERLNKQKEEVTSNKHPASPASLSSHVANTKLEDRLSKIEDEVYKRQNTKDPKTTPKDWSTDVDMIREEIEKLKKQFDSKRFGDKKRVEPEREHEEELANMHQSLKVERAKMNQDLKVVKDSVSLVAEKQIDQYKSLHEKLQAEILTRQQFECDTLRQMTVLDDKLIKIGSSFSLPNLKGIQPNKDIVVRDVDSIKKLIVDTERNLEQKIENSISKLKPSPMATPAADATRDFVRIRDLEELERNLAGRIEKCRESSEKNHRGLEKVNQWKEGVAEMSMKALRTDVDALKLHQMSTPLHPPTTSNTDKELLMELNKRVLKMDESIDDYKIHKELSNDAIEDLKKRIKILSKDPKPEENKAMPPANKNEGNKAKPNDGYVVGKEWKEQVDLSLDEVQKEIRICKEKVLHNEQKLGSLKKEIEHETKDRKQAIDEVKSMIKNVPPLPAPQQPEEPRINSAKEGLKKLANALQGTKNVLALKMQHEMKERENVISFLSKRVNDLDTQVDGIDERLHKLENDKKAPVQKLGVPKEKPKSEDPSTNKANVPKVS